MVYGCATPPQTRQLLASPPPELPRAVELEEVPFFAQTRYQCGPAALATVLQHGGESVLPHTLVSEVYIPERRGSLRTEMRAAVRARGLVPYPLAPELTALLHEVASGRPVLVLQNLVLDWSPRWHYAVVVGYDLEEREVILRSGTTRRLVTSMAVFERTWARGEHWAQAVATIDEPPRTAEPVTWLEALREREEVSDRPGTMPGYRAATRRWPASVPAWMARGNAAYALGAREEAEKSFRRAVTLAPERAAGWNNLAYALAAGDCVEPARAAARCAVALAPEDPGTRDTLREMESMPTGDTGARCGIPACPVEAPGTAANLQGAE